MNRAVKSCRKLLLMLKEIECTREFDAAHLKALKQDEASLKVLMEMIRDARDKQQLHEALLMMKELDHKSFGAFVGDKTGMLLTLYFEELRGDIIELFVNA